MGVFDDARKSGSYCLAVDSSGIEITVGEVLVDGSRSPEMAGRLLSSQASDYAGVRYAMATLVQIVRLHKFAARTQLNGEIYRRFWF